VFLAALLTSGAIRAEEISSERAAEAAARLREGLARYAEGDYASALAQLTRAHEIAGSYSVLYPKGLSEAQLARYGDALASLERYLEEGGEQLSRARRAEVTELLETIRAKTGRLQVRANLRGAVVRIDGTRVAALPLDEALVVGVGRRRVTLSKRGYRTEEKEVNVARDEVTTCDVELKPRVPSAVGDHVLEPAAWIAWIGTGVLAAATAGMAVAAWSTSANVDTARETGGVRESTLAEAESRVAVFTGASVAFGILTAASTGGAIYLSVAGPQNDAASRRFVVDVGWR
jgi:hypothetical protein